MVWMMAGAIAWVSASVGVGVVLGRTITRRDREDRRMAGADPARSD